MKNESVTETPSNETETSVESPRKLLLGKRVVRHFNVRSAVQTGGRVAQGTSDTTTELGTYSLISRRDD